jgi:hypothetical protein
VKTYEAHLAEWADREGQFVVIKGRDILGYYPHHEEAMEGLRATRRRAFLVK